MDNKKKEYEMKARTLDSIMRHPQLSRILSDSVKAPIGSTKRKQSQAALNIITKINKRTSDGTGGPGMFGTTTPAFPAASMGPVKQPLVSQPAPYKSNGVYKQDIMLPSGRKTTVIVGTTPKPKTTVGIKDVFNPSNIFGGIQGMTKGYLDAQKKGAQAALSLAGWGMSTIESPVASGMRTIENKWSNLDNPAQWVPMQDTASGKFAQWVAPKIGNSQTSAQQQTGSQTPAQQTPPAAGSQQLAGQQPGTPPTGDQAGATPPAGSPQTGSTQTAGTSQTGSYSGSSSIGIPSGTQTNVGGKTAQIATGTSSYLPGGQNDLGANYFAMKMMNDKKLLKELFPGVDEKDLPMGASLSDQINDLADRLKSDYHIELLGNEYLAKARAGVTLEQDLWNFTKTKDEQLNALEKMIGDAETRMANSDTSDPTVDAMNRNYLNYLTTMKGRANNRYIDMVSQSAKVFEQQLTGLEGSLNNAINQYNEDIQRKGAGLQEDYNKWYTTLTDMYNQVADAPRKQMELDLMQMQMDQAKMAMIETAAKLGTYGDGSGASDGLTSKEYREAYDFFNGVLIDKDKRFLAEGAPSIESLVAQARESGQSVAATVGVYANLLGNAISNASDPAEYSKLKKLQDSFYESMDSGSLSQLMSQNDIFKATTYMKAADLDQKSVSRDASLIRQNAQLYRDALKDLYTSKWFGLGGTKLNDAWLEKWKTQIDPEIALTIYNNIKSREDGQQLVSELLTMTENDDNSFVSGIMPFITK